MHSSFTWVLSTNINILTLTSWTKACTSPHLGRCAERRAQSERTRSMERDACGALVTQHDSRCFFKVRCSSTATVRWAEGVFGGYPPSAGSRGAPSTPRLVFPQERGPLGLPLGVWAPGSVLGPGPLDTPLGLSPLDLPQGSRPLVLTSGPGPWIHLFRSGAALLSHCLRHRNGAECRKSTFRCRPLSARGGAVFRPFHGLVEADPGDPTTSCGSRGPRPLRVYARVQPKSRTQPNLRTTNPTINCGVAPGS